MRSRILSILTIGLMLIICSSAAADNIQIDFQKVEAHCQSVVRTEITGPLCDPAVDPVCYMPPPSPGADEPSTFDVSSDEMSNEGPDWGYITSEAFVDVPYYGHNSAGVYWNYNSWGGISTINVSADGFSYGMPDAIGFVNHVSRYANGVFKFSVESNGPVTANIAGWAGRNSSSQTINQGFQFLIAKVIPESDVGFGSREEVVYFFDNSMATPCDPTADPTIDPPCYDPNRFEFSGQTVFEPGFEYVIHINSSYSGILGGWDDGDVYISAQILF